MRILSGSEPLSPQHRQLVPSDTDERSEGAQPHTIDLRFPKRVFISVCPTHPPLRPDRADCQAVAIRTSHPRDDSYTPSKVSVRAGNSVHDLQEVSHLFPTHHPLHAQEADIDQVQLKEFHKPDGWIHIPLRPMNADSGDGEEVEEG